MPSIEYSVDKRDIFFTLFEQLKIHEHLKFDAFADFDKEVYEMTLDEAVRCCVEALGPINRECDQVGATFEAQKVTMPDAFKRLYKLYCESGWAGFSHNPEYGGKGFPLTMNTVLDELITGANTSFALLPLLTHGSSHLIEAFGTEAQKKMYCEKMYSGEWGGTMCLTEPQAGSDLASIKTIAEPQGDHYLLTGTKIFITFGDQDATDNIVHLVLAKIPGGPVGTKGISLFVVPKYEVNPDGTLGERNDVYCNRIEHKMGIHSSPTCVMDFGSEGKCKGWLVGQEHRGMMQMFQMMNEARLGVAAQGLGGAAASYMSALGYALERKQGSHYTSFKNPAAPRSEIVFHPDVRRMLMSMKAYTEGIRGMLYATALYADKSNHETDSEAKEFALHMLELLIPVCKAYASDMGFRVCETAIQVYGGYGYTQDYPVEQYMRDTKIASIYEGSNGIQALDLFARKLGTKKGLRYQQFSQMVHGKVEGWKSHPLASLVSSFEDALNTLDAVTKELLGGMAKGELAHGLLSATPYLEMFGNVGSAYYLLDGAVLAHDKLQTLFADNGAETAEQKTALIRNNNDAAFYHGKVCTAQFFVHNILPKNLSIAATIRSQDMSAMDILFQDERDVEVPSA